MWLKMILDIVDTSSEGIYSGGKDEILCEIYSSADSDIDFEMHIKHFS